jgi:hypothetical protein
LPPVAKTADLSGPRFGLTLLSDGVVKTLEERDIHVGPHISQFGWQFEKQFYTVDSGLTMVTEWIALVGGLDQSVALPSLSWMVGVRMRDGAEFDRSERRRRAPGWCSPPGRPSAPARSTFRSTSRSCLEVGSRVSVPPASACAGGSEEAAYHFPERDYIHHMRVAIVGGPGIGKSTLVRQLGDLYHNGSYGEGEKGVGSAGARRHRERAQPVGVTAYFGASTTPLP